MPQGREWEGVDPTAAGLITSAASFSKEVQLTPDELFNEIFRNNPNASEKELREACCEALRVHPEIWRDAFDCWWQRTRKGPFEEETFPSA
jgi:hypothetical protein